MQQRTLSLTQNYRTLAHRTLLFARQHRAVIGVLVVLALVGIALASSDVAAVEQSTNEARIQGWVALLNADPPTTARLQAERQLELAGAPAVDALTASLHSSNPVLRRNAVEVLGYIAAPITGAPLQDLLLHDSDARVRVEAAWALSQLNNAAVAIPLERAAVMDSDAGVRQAARDALEGLRWSIAGMAQQDANSARAVAVPASLPNLVYLAVSDRVMVSNDSGRTWSSGGRLPSSVVTVEISPSNPNRVYAGTESLGLYRSDDRGATWVSVSTGLGKTPGSPVSASAIALDPKDSDHLYVARGTYIGTSAARLFPLGVMESRDGGKTWTDANFPATAEGITQLVLENGTLYAVAGSTVVSASQ